MVILRVVRVPTQEDVLLTDDRVQAQNENTLLNTAASFHIHIGRLDLRSTREKDILDRCTDTRVGNE